VSGAATGKPLALTIGEPAGIGLDIAIEAWSGRRSSNVPPFIFVGDESALKRRAHALGRDVPTASVAPGDAAKIFKRALPCQNGSPSVSGKPGTIDASDTAAVIQSIHDAVMLVRGGEAAAIVTNPIQKKALNAVGFAFPGHTEFLGALSGEIFGQAATPVMMLAGPELRVVPVTIHIPLADVPRALTTELIIATAKIVAHDLQRRFRIAKPRLAVAGLNPHAGEEGMLGPEDAAIVRPAVEALVASGIAATGPLPADTMFHAEARKTYDAALCMYHDQALIPIKTLAFDDAVNVTLGLPFVRTSPDHGTALSIAGTGKARAASLIAALKLAEALALRDAR
jgi:4-hydroxythreonine-4-phosphate dehydrogenase